MDKLLDSAGKSQLIQDLNVVVSDAEALLKATANQGGDKIAEVRTKVGESIRAVRASLEEAESALLDKSKAAAKATDVYVHENPWQSVGVAAAVGFVIGWLAKRH
jgi:ElaB/YqjD/DUF883 family membrane-anchored ribosome-binding protein